MTIFYLCFSESVCLEGHLTDLSMASILSASTGCGNGFSGGIYQINHKKHKQKFFFISIHKPPAWIEIAHIKHALAVTVEPYKFSPAEPVAYELS